MTTPKRRSCSRVALVMMYAGVGLTVVAGVVPFIGRGVLADHVRAGYPAYQPGAIDAAVTAYLAILSIVGVLGLAGWLGSIWAARAGKGWALLPAAGLFAAAVGVAIAALTIRDTSGDIGLAPLMGWLLVLPCVPGLAAIMLWRRTA